MTPLPPVHVATLVRALRIPEADLLETMEREYANKISARIGRTVPDAAAPGIPPPAGSAVPFRIPEEDRAQFQAVYDAFRVADPKTREAFLAVCETLLHVPKPAVKKHEENRG